MFKDSDKWVIEGNVQDNLLCVVNFSTSQTWKRFFEGGGFSSKETLKGLTTLWGFYQRFEVSINALRFLSTLLCFYRRFAVLLCVVNFSTSQTWKRFLWGRKLLKRNAYIFKNASANGRTYAGLTTLWGFYRRFEISIDTLKFLRVRGKLFNVADLKTFLVR